MVEINGTSLCLFILLERACALKGCLCPKRVFMPLKGVYAPEGCLPGVSLCSFMPCKGAYLKLVKPQGFRIISGN
jgi:hypothetical protein